MLVFDMGIRLTMAALYFPKKYHYIGTITNFFVTVEHQPLSTSYGTSAAKLLLEKVIHVYLSGEKD